MKAYLPAMPLKISESVEVLDLVMVCLRLIIRFMCLKEAIGVFATETISKIEHLCFNHPLSGHSRFLNSLRRIK